MGKHNMAKHARPLQLGRAGCDNQARIRRPGLPEPATVSSVLQFSPIFVVTHMSVGLVKPSIE